MDTRGRDMAVRRVRIGAACLTALALLIPAAGEAQSPGAFTPLAAGWHPGRPAARGAAHVAVGPGDDALRRGRG